MNEDFLIMSSSLFASMLGLALGILFCVGTVKIMLREPKLSEKQLAKLAQQPVFLMMPTNSTDVFNRQGAIRRDLEAAALAIRKQRDLDGDSPGQ